MDESPGKIEFVDHGPEEFAMKSWKKEVLGWEYGGVAKSFMAVTTDKTKVWGQKCLRLMITVKARE